MNINKSVDIGYNIFHKLYPIKNIYHIVTFYFVGPRKRRVLFLGHSFIYHLNITQMKKFMPSYDIAKYGIRGGKIIDVRDVASREIDSHKPDVVYIQVGGNDISKTTSSNVIATDILELAYYLLNMCSHSPKHVVIGGLFPRNLKGSTHVIYMKQKTDINRMLQFTAAGDLRLRYSTTKLFRESDLIDRDGVHLTKSGTIKWIRQMCRTLKSF